MKTIKLKDIMSISGKGGLFKFIAQARNGIVVESLEDKKRHVAPATARISSLEDIAGRDVVLKPDIIVEVKFEEIQKSPSYTSGYALRFPRFVKLRPDRGLEDMTTLSMVETSFERQRGRT